MSRESIQAIEDAVRAHLVEMEAYERETSEGDTYHEHLLGDWVLAYSTSGIQPNADGAMDTCWSQAYSTPDTSSPMSSLGLATWLTQTLRNNLAPVYDDDGETGGA